MKCVEDTPVKNESGFYVQTWKRTAMSSEEIENATKLRAKEVKDIRNNKLKDSDWVMLASSSGEIDFDIRVLRSWKTYRRRLREIADQPGFPWNISWPEQPK